MDDRPICFFDSGIGGTTILKEVVKLLPNEDYIYYADGKNNPYGQKSKEELFEIVDDIVVKLLNYDPKVIVCACNTATEMVLDDIKIKYPDMTFVGTVPAVKVVHDHYPDKKALILTTKGTYESKRFRNLYDTYKTEKSILVQAPELANLIETGQDTLPYLEPLLKNYKGAEIVVHGCTHFPLAEENMRKVLGDVTFIDGSKGIANWIKTITKRSSKKTGSMEFINSRDLDSMKKL